MSIFAARRAAFRALHEGGCFVMPNPWDTGGAKRLAKLGFPAIASTSAGAAWGLGKEDGELLADEVLDHLRMLVSATGLPVNADFENGFADAPDGVAANVRRAIETGVAGVSIEDQVGRKFYDFDLAVARIAAARAAIDASGENVMLIGRCEAYLLAEGDFGIALDRIRAYAAAGADCLFVPGAGGIDRVRELVAAVAPKPLSVGISGPGLSVAELAAAGVRRISTGGALAAAAWGAFDKAAGELREHGTMPSR